VRKRECTRHYVKEGTTVAKLNTEKRSDIPTASFAFPKQRKEPLEDAAHVRNAIARFNQVEGITDAERDEGWERVKAAARKYGVEVREKSWRELGESGR
jgi:hypothetical protein